MTKAITGNVLIGQSGGPTQVINRTLYGIVKEAKKHPPFRDIWGVKFGVSGLLDVNKPQLIPLGSVPEAKWQKIMQLPGAALGSCRRQPTAEDCQRLFEFFERKNIHYFFYIGGNDSALAAAIVNDIARKEGYELRVFHVPKTIDNDLLYNDHCPGYPTAARYVALSFMGDDLDNRSLPGIKINVVMGRDAGWLTAAAALARQRPGDGPHLIYLPERPLTLKKFLSQVEHVYLRHGRALIAVSEGMRGPDGHLVVQSMAIRRELVQLDMTPLLVVVHETGELENYSGGTKRDTFGHPQLSGTGMLGDFLASALSIWFHRKYPDKIPVGINNKKLRVRADTLGYAQRAFFSALSPVDQEEALEAGVFAVKQALKGDIDGSVIIKRTSAKPYRSKFKLEQLKKVAGFDRLKSERHRPLPATYINAQGNDVTTAFLRYGRPLVGELPDKAYLF